MKKRFSLMVGLATVVAACSCALAASTAPNSTSLCPPYKQSYEPDFDVKMDGLSLRDLTARADSGNAGAMVLLGLRYTPGRDTAPEDQLPIDLQKAMALFQRAAAKGNAFAEYLVGVAYMGGAGVAKDEAKAVEWFKRGAAHGNVSANYWFGEMTAKGRGGLKENWEAAIPNFRAAAAGGVSDAYVELAIAYEKGYGGLARNDESAAYCYRQGAKLNSQLAQYNLRVMIAKGRATWRPDDVGPAPEQTPASPN